VPGSFTPTQNHTKTFENEVLNTLYWYFKAKYAFCRFHDCVTLGLMQATPKFIFWELRSIDRNQGEGRQVKYFIFTLENVFWNIHSHGISKRSWGNIVYNLILGT
jgi:hypothetical protein